MKSRAVSSWSLALIAVAAALCATPAAADPPRPKLPKFFKPKDLAPLKAGSGDKNIGIFRGGDEEPPRGPNAFVVLPGGNVVILDNENERLVFLDADGNVKRTVPAPGSRAVSALAMIGPGKFAAFDQQREELTSLSDKGGPPDPLKHLLPPRISLVRILPLGEGKIAFQSDKKTYVLDLTKPPPKGPPDFEKLPSTTLTPVRGGRFVGTSVQGGAGKLVMQTDVADDKTKKEITVDAPSDGKLASLAVVGGDKKGRIAVRIEMITATSPELQVRRYLRVYGPDLAAVDTFEVPSDDVIIGDQDMQVDEDGNIYVLLTYPDRVTVKRWSVP